MAGPRQVFLSHTSELRDYPAARSFVAAAEAAVNRSGDAVTDMKYFAAREDQPAAYCQARVQECDIYVGLIGLRYGSPVRDRRDFSYTELEFEVATKAGLPRLMFLLDEDAPLGIPPSKLLDSDPRMQARQRAFRDRLLDAGLMMAKVARPEQLEVELLHALQEGSPHGRASAPDRAGGLPVPPDLVGRDGEVAMLVQSWLTTPPQSVAVLGAPGIGKSAISLAALHHEQVVDRFGDRRWFIRCDVVRSAKALLSSLAAELGVIGDGPPGTVLGRVRAVLGAGPAVLVLDNFETPWTADPVPVEELLRVLGTIPQIAIAVSARGAARPAGLRWHDIATIGPLELTYARRLFLAVAGSWFVADPRLDELLSELDGVPLAVELMGYAAQGQPSLHEVAARWRTERTGMLQRMGGASRELSLAVSVETSIANPLMTAPARRLLTLLGVLPDGISHADLVALVPDNGLAAAAVIRQLGLAFDQGTRLRMLAPVRDHTAAVHPPDPADLYRLISYYAQLVVATKDQISRNRGAEAVTRLRAETGNITAMAERAAASRRIDELIGALCDLADYWRFTAFLQPALDRTAHSAMGVPGTVLQQARTWLALGLLARVRSDLDGADVQFDWALSLYQQAGDVLGEANCVRKLGEIALERSDLYGAGMRFDQALSLYRQAGDVLGEAYCVSGRGDIALARFDYEEARVQYGRALQLFQQVGSVLGEADCASSLGNIAVERSDLDDARAQFERAVPLYRQLGDVLGEANCAIGLGDIAVERSDPEGARVQFDRALTLYQAIPELYSAGWALVRLARLEPRGADRARRWEAACQAWASTSRNDLIEFFRGQFE
jgi:tetratricopeptide (TPR) repeat protein